SDWRSDIERTVEVPMTTLELAIEKYGVPQLCKIDVEGFEFDVLQGLRRPIQLVTFEYHRRRIPAAVACLNYLCGFGPIEITLTSTDAPQFSSQHWVDPDGARQFLE